MMPASSKQPMSDRKKGSFFKKCRANNAKIRMAADLNVLTGDERKAQDQLLDKVLAGSCASMPGLPCSLSNRTGPVLVLQEN